MEPEQGVAEALVLDGCDLLVVVAGKETQILAAQFERRDLRGDEVVDVGEDPRPRRDRGWRGAKRRRELRFREATGLLAL